MASFDLNPREERLLEEILRSYLSDLRMEIVDTERMELRESMKEQKKLIIRILERLAPQTASGSCCGELAR